MFKSSSYSSLFTGITIGVVLASVFFISVNREITTETIAHAEKISGLEFTEAQREQMLSNLQGNIEAYDTLRKHQIPNHVPLPLYFDPTPPGKIIENDPQQQNYWQVPSGIELPEYEEDLAYYTVTELASLIRERKISVTDLTIFFLNRVKQYNDDLEAIVTITEERALEQAEKLDEELADGHYRGPLHGIPYGAKDLFAVEGYKTTWGATPYQDQQIDQTATVIEKLDEAGAVLIAKTTLGALAYGDIWYGGRTNNPWNTEDGSSGSSAGSAAGTSAGLFPFALGTETLGSIVSPSTRTGVTGLRPTFGRVSRHGAMALSWSMDKVGPITRSVEDAALVFDVIRGPDGYDHTVKDYSFNYQADVNLSDIRIGYIKSAFDADYTQAETDREVLKVLEELGADLIPVELPDLPLDGMFNILTAEGAAAFDELTLTGRDSLLVWQEDNAWPNLFRSIRFLPAVEWIQFNRVRAKLISEMDEAIKDVDIYISPAFVGGNLLITNLTGHPSVVMKNGYTDEGQPISITFTGQLFDESTLVSVAKAYQEATSFHKEHPPLFSRENN